MTPLHADTEVSHADTELMHRMARTLGVDLRRMLDSGTLDPDTLKRLERRCQVCSSPQDCARRVKSHARGFIPPDVPWPPPYCINRKFLDFLARLERAPEPPGG